MPPNNGGDAIIGYNIYYSETQGIGISGIKIDAGNGTSCDVIGLTNGKQYYFVVTAFNSEGESAVSVEAVSIPRSASQMRQISTH